MSLLTAPYSEYQHNNPYFEDGVPNDYRKVCKLEYL